MYKNGSRVQVQQHNVTGYGNEGTIIGYEIRYIVKMDFGLTGKFNSKEIKPVKIIEERKKRVGL